MKSGSQQIDRTNNPQGIFLRAPEQQAATSNYQQLVFPSQASMPANFTLGPQYTSPQNYQTQYKQQPTSMTAQAYPITTYLPSTQPTNIPSQPISGQAFSVLEQQTNQPQMTGGVIKGESRIEYFPYQREYIEYVTQEIVEYIPKERKFTEYYAVQFDIEYLPQVIQEKYYEYVPVEQIRERIEYQAIQKQTVLSGPTMEIPKTNEYNIQTTLPTRTTIPSNQSQPNYVPQSQINYAPQLYEIPQAAAQQNQVYTSPQTYYQPQSQPVYFTAQQNQQVQPEELSQYIEQPISVISQPQTYQSISQYQPMVTNTKYQPVTAKSLYTPSQQSVTAQYMHQTSQASPLKSSQQVKLQPRQ